MTGRVHLSYVEPHSTRGTWTSPPSCFESEEMAEAHRRAITFLAGPDAAKRRTWVLTVCDCEEVTR
jgi:hypothetical protein